LPLDVNNLFLLNAFQKKNHFKRTSQMTTKDKLTRNLKRMRANFGKVYNFYPKSYQFPLQYSEFVTMTQRKKDAFNKNKLLTSNGNKMMKKQKRFLNSEKNTKQTKKQNAVSSQQKNEVIWIAKPSSGRRGENISLFTDVSTFNYNQPMIIQRYISNPLLIGGYKFDLRIYVLLTSVRPLNIYCYNDGLCRFSTQQYDLSNLENVYSHLTNSSINKKSDTLKKNKLIIGEGCKWTINKLFEYLQTEIDNEQNIKRMDNDKEQEEIKKIDIRKKIWKKIHDIIILTILPIITDVEQCPNCFELFGFDVLIDSNYNCWLLEVNGSPAIAINSDVDQLVKKPMLNDLIDCIQNQFGSITPNNNKHIKTKKYLSKSSKSSSRESSIFSDPLSNKLDSMDLSSYQESYGGSLETVESKDNNDEVDLFRHNVGGFEQIFPFNANTYESNQVLTNLSDEKMMIRAQKFRRIVVKAIKKRKYKKMKR